MDIYRKAVELIHTGTPFAVAMVVNASGSTPQKAGAKALFERGGTIWGTLGGGCLEAESRRRALEAMDQGACRVFDLSLDDDYGWDDGLICGGRVRIFVNPEASMNVDAYQHALTTLERRGKGILVTRIGGAKTEVGKAQWLEADEINSDLAHTVVLRKCLADEKPVWLTADENTAEGVLAGEVFVEPMAAPPRLVIAGGGYIGRATAHLGAQVGFEITVIDDRPSFVDPTRMPDGARTICGNIAEEVKTFAIDPDTYIVIVTRGHRHDAEALAACIHSPAAYIGMIGSKRKIRVIQEQFIEKGIASEEEFGRVLAPIGLDIGAETVEEIAVSIVAQLVAVRRGRREKCGPLAEAARA